VGALRLDRSHRWWAAGTAIAGVVALGLYWYVNRQRPGPWTGGSRAGLLFAIAGGLAMLLAAFLTPLRYLPVRWRLGPRQTWLRIHIWLGALSAVLIFCHSGPRFGGLFETVLYLLFILTIATGVLGLAIQQFLPRWLLSEVPCEVPYDQLPHLCAQLVRRADQLVKEARAAALPAETRDQLDQAYDRLLRPFLVRPRSWPVGLASPLKVDEVFAKIQRLPGLEAVAGKLATLKTYCHERRLLAEQERLAFWLHGWLYIHVPLSAAMLILAAVHAGVALYY
jgi:hypothetical protein